MCLYLGAALNQQPMPAVCSLQPFRWLFKAVSLNEIIFYLLEWKWEILSLLRYKSGFELKVFLWQF